MKRINFIILFAIVATTTLFACSAQKKTTAQLSAANKLYYEKDYQSAFAAYEQIINSLKQKGKEIDPEIYASAGKSQYYSGNKAKAEEYLKTALQNDYEDEQMLFILAEYYKNIDNLSKEIEILEEYIEKFPNGYNIETINERMFQVNCEIKSYNLAEDNFSTLTESQKAKEKNLSLAIEMFRHNQKKELANQYAQQLYKINPNNIVALAYKARDCYDSVEKEYVAAIKKYEAKKTPTAYQTMKKTVTPLASRYKQARDLYLKLYKQTKKPEDAAILSRIYTRLNDTKNSKYYEKLSKQ